MRRYTEINTSNGKAKLYEGFTQGDIPKTYKKITVLSYVIGNEYNYVYSKLLSLFQAKDKSLRYEIYRDGNFYPYYGKFEYIA